MAFEGVVLSVGGVILELIPSARIPLGENLVHLLDGRRRRLWRRYLLGGVAGRDPSRPDGGRLAGGLAGGLTASGELEGGCRAHAAVIKILLAVGGRHMDVGFGCLQRTAAAGVAWQLSVRCGTASKGGACGTGIMG